MASQHIFIDTATPEDKDQACNGTFNNYFPADPGDFRMSATFPMRLLIAITLSVITPFARAAISTTGDVTPAPPGAGGNVVGPFNIGNTGTGTMNIAGGTALTSTSQAFVGNGVDAVGIVTMSGLGSDWTLTTAGADLFVGNQGVGSLTVSNLAKLTVPDSVTVGNASGTGQGQINVTGLGSRLDIGGFAIVGGTGVGIVEVTNGGQVTADTTIVSNGTGDGRLTVSGNLSRWQTVERSQSAAVVVIAAGRCLSKTGDASE